MSKFPCPYCRGEGSWVEAVLDDGSGPEVFCGFCGGERMIVVGSEKHMEIKRQNPPKHVLWEWIGELGLALNEVIDALEKKSLDANPRSKFPGKQKLWASRRYWPAVVEYFNGTESGQKRQLPKPEIRYVYINKGRIPKD